MRLVFDPCFPQKRIVQLSATLPKTYHELDKMCPWMRGKWPSRVHCMRDSDISKMRRRGAGHGFTFKDRNGIWLNHYMSQWGYWLVFVHENLHHGYVDAEEGELNCVHLPRVFKAVFGKNLDPEWARQHGVGASAPNVGDRSYCR